MISDFLKCHGQPGRSRKKYVFVRAPGVKGFTLVEVMISSVILFSALAIGTIAYRTSIKSVDKINAAVIISDALPSIMEMVKTEVMTGRDDGEGSFGPRIQYFWNSERIASSRNTVKGSSFDKDRGKPKYGLFRVSLQKIYLTIRYWGESGREEESRHEYQELLWSRSDA